MLDSTAETSFCKTERKALLVTFMQGLVTVNVAVWKRDSWKCPQCEKISVYDGRKNSLFRMKSALFSQRKSLIARSFKCAAWGCLSEVRDVQPRLLISVHHDLRHMDETLKRPNEDCAIMLSPSFLD